MMAVDASPMVTSQHCNREKEVQLNDDLNYQRFLQLDGLMETAGGWLLLRGDKCFQLF